MASVERVEDQIIGTLRRLPGVAAAYVVTPDGVAAASGAGEVAGAEGALLAALAGALQQATDDLSLGGLSDAIIEAQGGAILAAPLADGRTAVVRAQAGANLGMIRLELRRLRRQR